MRLREVDPVGNKPRRCEPAKELSSIHGLVDLVTILSRRRYTIWDRRPSLILPGLFLAIASALKNPTIIGSHIKKG